jgi:hypothetical protein
MMPIAKPQDAGDEIVMRALAWAEAPPYAAGAQRALLDACRLYKIRRGPLAPAALTLLRLVRDYGRVRDAVGASRGKDGEPRDARAVAQATAIESEISARLAKLFADDETVTENEGSTHD